jgi:hypothetical protein
VPCADDFFCDGSDDRQHPCPSSSLGRAATNVSECLCNVSFEVVHSAEGTRGVAVVLVDAAMADVYRGGLLARGYRPSVQRLG